MSLKTCDKFCGESKLHYVNIKVANTRDGESMKKLGPFQTSNFTCARASARIPILTWLAHTTQVLWVLKSLGIYSDYGKKHWTTQRYTSHFLRFSSSHRTALRVVLNLKWRPTLCFMLFRYLVSLELYPVIWERVWSRDCCF